MVLSCVHVPARLPYVPHEWSSARARLGTESTSPGSPSTSFLQYVFFSTLYSYIVEVLCRAPNWSPFSCSPGVLADSSESSFTGSALINQMPDWTSGP